MSKTIDDYLKEIGEDNGKDQYSFGVLFSNLTEDAEEAIGGNCVLFSMTEKTARALDGIRNELAKGKIGSIKIDMPSFLTTGVRNVDCKPENKIAPIAKGYLDDILVDDGYYPDNVSIEIRKDGINIEISTETEPGDGNLNVRCVAKIPGDLLVRAVEEAKDIPTEKFADLAERLFDGESAPSMSPR